MLGDATKVSPALMQSGKEYVCLMELHGDISHSELTEALNYFTGDIYQVPPVRAAVARRPRVRTVYYMDLLEAEGRFVLFRVGCSGGTYVRKLCHDIGEYVGVGAHMEELRRTRAGPFTEDKSVSLLELYETWLNYQETGDETRIRQIIRPVEEAVNLLPKVYLLDTAVDAVCHGADLMAPGISVLESGISKGDMVALMTLKGELVALGYAVMTSEEMLSSSEGVAVDVKRVIMERLTYPPVWKGGLRHRIE